MKYLITGGSGLIGREITQLILKENDQVNWLSTSKKKQNGVATYSWDLEKGTIESGCFDGVNAIIHLAGAGVADHKWTPAYKKLLITSRIDSAQLLFKELEKIENRPKVIISASAIGIYGNLTAGETSENAAIGDSFLAELTQNWENEVDKLEQLGIRVVKLRIGIVLAADGGFIKKVAAPAKFGFAAALGNGKMQTSWIHITDLANMFLFGAKNDQLHGAYNAVAPNPVSNYEITKQIAKALHKPFFLPNIPAFVLKLIFGEMTDMLLSSQHVSAKKIQAAGFSFKYKIIQEALKNILDTNK
jgi:uncharacterized protein